MSVYQRWFLKSLTPVFFMILTHLALYSHTEEFLHVVSISQRYKHMQETLWCYWHRGVKKFDSCNLSKGFFFALKKPFHNLLTQAYLKQKFCWLRFTFFWRSPRQHVNFVVSASRCNWAGFPALFNTSSSIPRTNFLDFQIPDYRYFCIIEIL